MGNNSSRASKSSKREDSRRSPPPQRAPSPSRPIRQEPVRTNDDGIQYFARPPPEQLRQRPVEWQTYAYTNAAEGNGQSANAVNHRGSERVAGLVMPADSHSGRAEIPTQYGYVAAPVYAVPSYGAVVSAPPAATRLPSAPESALPSPHPSRASPVPQQQQQSAQCWPASGGHEGQTTSTGAAYVPNTAPPQTVSYGNVRTTGSGHPTYIAPL